MKSASDTGKGYLPKPLYLYEYFRHSGNQQKLNLPE